jgi:hypothetical protein
VDDGDPDYMPPQRRLRPRQKRPFEEDLSDPAHALLAGGMRMGDRVASLIDNNKVKKGDVGTVVGPCADESASDPSHRVCVDFGEDKGRANYLAKFHLEHALLAGGYQKGDRVVSLIDKNTIKKGDVGTVLGSCTDDSAADKADRVSVDFGEGKGRASMHAMLQLEHVLAGGFHTGDRVVSLVNFNKRDGHFRRAAAVISKGELGTVVGPCTNKSAADKSARVSVDFGEGKRRANYLNYLAIHLEHAPLAGGYRKGYHVVSLVNYDKISKGDMGTVVGPCADESAADRAERVSVDFGEGKGRANMHAMLQLEHALLAGGFRKGDRVASLVHYNKISKGDVGTVIGPCADQKAADKAERLSVNFGEDSKDKGRTNMHAFELELLAPSDLAENPFFHVLETKKYHVCRTVSDGRGDQISFDLPAGWDRKAGQRVLCTAQLFDSFRSRSLLTIQYPCPWKHPAQLSLLFYLY